MIRRLMLAAAAAALPAVALAGDARRDAILAGYAAKAGVASFSARRGESLFRTRWAGGDARTASCTACHTDDPASPAAMPRPDGRSSRWRSRSIRALHRRRDGREAVRARLPQRARPRMHAAREGRLHHLHGGADRAVSRSSWACCSPRHRPSPTTTGCRRPRRHREEGMRRLSHGVPAGFLPARSWDRIIEGLAEHFGEDATCRPIAPRSSAAISSPMPATPPAGAARKYMRWVAPGGAPLRITRTRPSCASTASPPRCGPTRRWSQSPTASPATAARSVGSMRSEAALPSDRGRAMQGCGSGTG